MSSAVPPNPNGMFRVFVMTIGNMATNVRKIAPGSVMRDSTWSM